MAILGLLILAVAVLFGVETAVSNRSDVVVETFGYFSTVPVTTVFLVGALCMALATLGLFMITGSVQRRRRVHTDAKHRMRDEQVETRLTDTDRTNAELVEENDRLRAELAAERRAAATMGGVAVPPGVGNVTYGDQVSDAVRSETISETGRFDPYPTDAGTGGIRQDGTVDENEKVEALRRFKADH